MAIKPTSTPAWTTANPGVRAEPTGSKKNTGWGIDERPAREFMNWLFFNITEWIDYFEAVTDQFGNLYQAIVGTGPNATHADLNAVMADGAIAAGARILVESSATINTIQQITKHKVQIDFQPGVIYTEGSASTGIQISADRVKIVGGEFASFATAGILVDVGSDFTKIRDTHFQGCTSDITDNSVSTDISGTSTEV